MTIVHFGEAIRNPEVSEEPESHRSIPVKENGYGQTQA